MKFSPFLIQFLFIAFVSLGRLCYCFLSPGFGMEILYDFRKILTIYKKTHNGVWSMDGVKSINRWPCHDSGFRSWHAWCFPPHCELCGEPHLFSCHQLQAKEWHSVRLKKSLVLYFHMSLVHRKTLFIQLIGWTVMIGVCMVAHR